MKTVKGFLLLETLVLAAVLVLMAGALLVYRQGLRMEAQTRFEGGGYVPRGVGVRAAGVPGGCGDTGRRGSAAAGARGLLAGSIGVLGRWRLPAPRTDIQRMEQAGAYRAAVTVAWQHGGRQQQQIYQRRVGTYEEQ